MKKNLVLVTFCIVIALFGAMHLKKTLISQETFGDTILKSGSQGGDVYELQGRLKYLGYYNGNIDGDFGWQTLRGVEDFQYKFGMVVDGVVGGDTKVKLWSATKDWSPDRTSGNTDTGTGYAGNGGAAAGGDNGDQAVEPSNHLGYTANDLKLMANAVHGEARGEPYVGQVAVAAVIINRVASSSFPNTISGVIFQPGAFTAVSDGQIWLEPDDNSKRAVQDALSGWDPSDGSIYYFNPATATSSWIWSRSQVKTIGKHIFCK